MSNFACKDEPLGSEIEDVLLLELAEVDAGYAMEKTYIEVEEEGGGGGDATVYQ